jgi:hypothetical protein
MIRSAIFITAVVLLALGLALLQECRFLVPYRAVLINSYGETILVFGAVLAVNVFTGVYLVCRKLLLKDTGRKLAHVEKQLRDGERISEELRRLFD